jgi:hypothetical protein
MDLGSVANVSDVHDASIFNPEDGCIMYIRNVDKIAHIHRVRRPKNRIYIKRSIKFYLII